MWCTALNSEESGVELLKVLYIKYGKILKFNLELSNLPVRRGLTHPYRDCCGVNKFTIQVYKTERENLLIDKSVVSHSYKSSPSIEANITSFRQQQPLID